MTTSLIETFEFDRHGEFSCSTFGDYHCSTLSHPTIRYRVLIFAAGSALDSRGFLLDQLDCPQYFSSITSTDLSCERLCEKAAKDIFEIATAENPHLSISHLEVSLSPEPFEITITSRLNTSSHSSLGEESASGA